MRDEKKQENYELAERLLAEQNFSAAVIAGAVATVLAVVGYAAIVGKFPVVYGFAAAGVGIVIGQAMQIAGRGIEMKFSVVATAYTIIGCVVGHLLMARTFSGITFVHFVYWFVAVFAAVFFARRALSRADRLALGMHALRD